MITLASPVASPLVEIRCLGHDLRSVNSRLWPELLSDCPEKTYEEAIKTKNRQCNLEVFHGILRNRSTEISLLMQLTDADTRMFVMSPTVKAEKNVGNSFN